MSKTMPRRKVAHLVAATTLLGVVWLLLLPWCARQPAMREHLRWLQQRRIDPSAMYYTELEAMEPILARQRRHQLARIDGETR